MDLVEATSRVPARRHPWEVARAAFLLRILDDAGLPRAGATVLDVGAGDAWFAARLADAAPGTRVTCWDPGYEASTVPLPASPSLAFVHARPTGRFGLALLLDVLEHVEDDAGFLLGIVRDHLEPGAHVLISVPAWPLLFGEHDRRLRHHRRYTPAAARALIAGAGLGIRRSGGLFHSLVVPRLLANSGRKLAAEPTPAHAGEWRHGPFATAVVSAMLSADGAVSRLSSSVGLQLPGLSWWALCRRPS